MSRKVYCVVDEYNNVIDAIRGEGIVLTDDELWEDVSHIDNATNLTEGHFQRSVKVFKEERHDNGRKKPAVMMLKPDFKMKVNKVRIMADGKDAAIVIIESVDEVIYDKPIKLYVNGVYVEVEVGEELSITSNINQRIGIQGVDPNIRIVPKTIFIQATGGNPVKEEINTKRGKIQR